MKISLPSAVVLTVIFWAAALLPASANPQSLHQAPSRREHPAPRPFPPHITPAMRVAVHGAIPERKQQPNSWDYRHNPGAMTTFPAVVETIPIGHPFGYLAHSDGRKIGPADRYFERHFERHPDQYTEGQPVIRVHARIPVVFYSNVRAVDAGWQVEADWLRKAYYELSLADHDYDGHRVAAMRQTATAGEMVGIYLRGDGNGEESQGESDAHMAAARHCLEEAFTLAEINGSLPIAAYVNQAIEEIDIALEVK